MLKKKILIWSGLACCTSIFATAGVRAMEIDIKPVRYDNVAVSRVVEGMVVGHRRAGFKLHQRARLHELGHGEVVDELVFEYRVRGIRNPTGRVSYHLTYKTGQKVCAPCEVLAQGIYTVGGDSNSLKADIVFEKLQVADVKANRNVGILLGRRLVRDDVPSCPAGKTC